MTTISITSGKRARALPFPAAILLMSYPAAAQRYTVFSIGELIIEMSGSAFGTVLSGGWEYVSSGGVDEGGTTIFDGGGEIVSSGGTAIAAVISGGGQQLVNGTATSTTILIGGNEYVGSGLGASGTAGNTTISGGTSTSGPDLEQAGRRATLLSITAASRTSERLRHRHSDQHYCRQRRPSVCRFLRHRHSDQHYCRQRRPSVCRLLRHRHSDQHHNLQWWRAGRRIRLGTGTAISTTISGGYQISDISAPARLSARPSAAACSSSEKDLEKAARRPTPRSVTASSMSGTGPEAPGRRPTPPSSAAAISWSWKAR